MSAHHHYRLSISQHLSPAGGEVWKNYKQGDVGCCKLAKKSFLQYLLSYSLIIILMEGTAAFEQSWTKPVPMKLNQAAGLQAPLKTEESSQENRTERSLIGKSPDVIYKLRKQMNQILAVLSRRCDGRDHYTLETMILMVLDLIKGKDNAGEGLYNAKNLDYSGNLHFEQINYGRAKKSDRLRIAIVEPLHTQGNSPPTHVQLIVIDYAGKMQQYRHHVKILADLSIFVARLHRMCGNLAVFVKKNQREKQSDTKIYLRLHKLLRGCEVSEVQCIGGEFTCFRIYGQASIPHAKLETSYNNFQNQDCRQILTKFYLIRDYLLQNSTKISKKMHQSAFTYLFPFAYNIISHLLYPSTPSLKAQIQHFLPEIEQLMRHLTQELQGRKVENKDEHFPIPLINAQVCWRCKTRGFICCSTCSTLEAKKISLCLDCYGPHHQTLTFLRQKQLVKNRLGRWQDMDIQVNGILQQEWLRLFQSGSVVAKKQQ